MIAWMTDDVLVTWHVASKVTSIDETRVTFVATYSDPSWAVLMTRIGLNFTNDSPQCLADTHT